MIWVDNCLSLKAQRAQPRDKSDYCIVEEHIDNNKYTYS